jgi:hypothetical protein
VLFTIAADEIGARGHGQEMGVQAVDAHLPPVAEERPGVSIVTTGSATCANVSLTGSCPRR